MCLIVKLFTIAYFLLTTSRGIQCEIVSNRFQVIPCTDAYFKQVLEVKPEHESHHTSLLRCATACNHDASCDYAVYRPFMQRCSHVSNTNFTTLTVLSTEAGTNCSILRKNRKLKCQNGGNPLRHICQCPNDWTGRECETPNMPFCQNGSWRQIQSHEHEMLTESLLEMKAIIRAQNVSYVERVRLFKMKGSNGFKFQTSHFLHLLLGNFSSPLKRVFRFVSTGNKMTVLHVGMTWALAKQELQVPNFDVWIRDSIDNERLVFHTGVLESIELLMNGLSNGYRILGREFRRVGFNRGTGDAFYENLKVVDWGQTGNPLYFFLPKMSLKINTVFISRWEIASGQFKRRQTETRSKPWEFDRCWVKINPTLEYDEFTHVLKEIVLSGRDVRLVMGESISTDVAMVTVIKNDVVATLADYLTHFDADSPLDGTSRHRFPFISRSKVLAECEKVFQGSTVYGRTTEIYDGSLQWFVCTRPFTKLFTVISGGQTTFGSSRDVYNATSKGLNIRVCMELEADALWTCTGSTVITKHDNEDHLELQAPEGMALARHENGTFAGIQDADCKHVVMLVSTEGWIKTAVFSIGTEFSPDDLQELSFVSISWFVEQQDAMEENTA